MTDASAATEVPVKTRGALIPLLGLLLLEALILMIPGHLAITGHEVDVLHATSAVMRVVEGERPHLDFLTPLGPMSFYPVAWFVEAGMGIGRAWLAANLLVAAALLPAILYLLRTRMPGPLGIGFGAFLIILCSAAVYGGDQATVSISMAYNRWGWAVAFVVLALLILPPREGGGTGADGIILGLCLGYLAVLKITFFVILLPVVLIGLAGQWRKVLEMVVAGLAVAALATLLFGGLGFWTAYARDVLIVAGSDVRPYPGLELRSLFAAPAYLPGTVCLLALVVALRLTGASRAGMLLLFALPGLVYATYQNWGNDPKWLVLVGVLALAFAPRAKGELPGGLPAQQGLWVIAAASFAIIAPSIINLTISPLRNAMASAEDYVPFLADTAHAGLWIERERSYDGEATVLLPPLPDPLAEEEASEPILLGGVEIMQCTQKSAYYGKIRATADRLHATGYGDKALLYVDVTNPLPLVGGFPRLPKEAPWYYGGTAALGAAEFLVVPKCGSSNTTFRAYVAALDAAATWDLVTEETHYFVFRAR